LRVQAARADGKRLRGRAVGLTQERFEHHRARPRMDVCLNRLREIDLAKEVVLLQPGQRMSGPAPARAGVVAVGIVPGEVARRKPSEGAVVAVQRNADLIETARALHASGGLADFLHGGQQQADEHGDDGNHHQ
jgi:hypothetical protein